ncbi:MAG: VWA domain-containing protein [Bryobacteraceae bacterium]|jgi:VWFA-related protein
MRITPVLLLTAFVAGGQQPQREFTFNVTSQLVIVNVAVRDSSGRPIENLKASDFTLSEDDKPQKLSVFEYQKLESAPLPPIAPTPALATRPAAPAPKTPVREAISTSKPGQIRYKDRRLMVLFFDFSSMEQPEQIRAQKAATQFLQQQMTEADLVAIMAFSTQLQVLQDFTADREQLLQVIRGFHIGEGSELAALGATDSDDAAQDTGAAFTADDTEFNIFNTDRKLSALESAAKMLASLPEKKALVYFSSGVGKTGVENQSQLRATVNAAVRSNVSFYTIDARGLVATPAGGDATQASARGPAMYSGAAQRSRAASFNDSQETLTTLAGDTGGKALLDSNDLTLGMRQAQESVSSYYILGYYSTNPALDGRYRRVKVQLASRLKAKLDYRSGYFAPKQFKEYNTSDKERQLEEALLLGDPITDLSLALEVNYFRLARDRYFVPLAVKIPGSELELARKGGNESTVLDFIGQVRDARGRIAGTVRDSIEVKLKGENLGQLGKRFLEYGGGFTLMPGEYTLKFLCRENATGKMGTFETKFTVPDVVAEQKSLRLSSVVWANQREPLSAAVGSAERNKKLLADDPLVKDGYKLVPSITKVYRKDQDLYVFFEVYDPGAEPSLKTADISASVSFFRGKLQAFQSEPLRLTETPAKGNVVGVHFRIPLATFAPGPYTCQVNVIDELGKKFAFRRAPMVLLP